MKEKEYDELFAKYNDVKNVADEEAAYNKVAATSSLARLL